jgi:hypothetical protein
LTFGYNCVLGAIAVDHPHPRGDNGSRTKAAGPANKESILTKYHSFWEGPNSAEI